MMVRHSNGVVSYAPLYRHVFRFVQPHFLADAEKFNIDYPDPTQLDSTADKLRHYRYKKGLLQREVAEYANIERTTYSDYEDTERDYYPLDVMEQIAEVLEVEIIELLDEYNMFLFLGQSRQIKQFRKSLGLTQKVLAAQLGVNKTTYKRWEYGKVRMSKATWQKIFYEI